MLTNKKIWKDLIPGRVLIVTHKNHINKIAILLNANVRSNVTYKVLVLTDTTEDDIQKESDDWYKMISIAFEVLYKPLGVINHDVLTIESNDIFKICAKIVKIDADLVIKDWEKRQIPRFKDSPPGQACSFAIQELQKLTMTAADSQIEFIHINADDPNLYTHLMHLGDLEIKLKSLVSLVQITNFAQQFRIVFDRKSLEDELTNLEYAESHRSLSLIPDYESRIKVLQELKYVDEHKRIELKGKVACEIGMNELMITELVLENILKNLKPAEVAALLSSLVFQNKNTEESYDKPLEKNLERVGSLHIIKLLYQNTVL